MSERARYEKRRRFAAISGRPFSVPALGAQRRIQALMRLGWSTSEIATAAGYSHRNRVRQILNGQKGKPCRWIERKTFDTIARVYDELAMKLPPERDGHERSVRGKTRAHARRNQWPPPLAWDDVDDPDEQPHGLRERHTKHDVDPVVVERVIAGDRLPMTRAERFAVVTTMRERGWSFLRIEAQTGIGKPERYVERAEGVA